MGIESVKRLGILVLCIGALSAQAGELLRCEQFAEMMQVPSGQSLSQAELDSLRREANDPEEFPAMLAMMQLCGVGLPKDEAKGMQTLKAAAEKGSVLSRAILESIAGERVGVQSNRSVVVRKEVEDDADYQFKQGLTALWGLRNDQNLLATEKWWLKSASQGHESSQLALGVLYFDLKRYREAAAWLELSAQAGYSLPQFLLGKMFYFGWGVTQDFALSQMWAGRAASSGNSHVKIWLAEVQRKAPAEIVNEQLEIDRAYQARQAASGGKPELYYLSLVSGEFAAKPTDRSPPTSRSQTRSNPRKMFLEGVSRWYGGLGEQERQDQTQGLQLIRGAAEKNYVDAVFWLARAYHHGSDLPANSVVSYALYFRAESLQGSGGVSFTDFKPPFETPLNEMQLRKAQQLTHALAEPGNFLKALDLALAAGE